MGRRARRGEGRGRRRAAARDRCASIASAHASLEELYRPEAVRGRHGGRHARLAHAREAAAGGHQVQSAGGRRAERARRPRSRLRGRRARRRPADVSSLRSAVDAGQVKRALRVRPGPGRLDWRHRLDHRRAAGREDSDADRAGRAAHAARRSGRHRAAGIGVRREGRDLHQHDRPCAGVVARDYAAGRCRRRLADSAEARRGLRLAGRVSRRRAPSARRSRASWPACPATRRSRRSRFARPVSARHWLQASNPSERWKWDSMFQDLPPIKFGEDFGPMPRGSDPADRSEV